MGEHAKLSPSASARWLACPGSVRLIESLPADRRDRPSIDGMWGTACHALLEHAMVEAKPPSTFVGDSYVVSGEAEVAEFTEDERTHEWTAEDAANVGAAYHYAVQRMQEYGPSTSVLVEERVDCGSNFHRFDPVLEMEVPAPLDDCWGTADIVLHGGGFLEVIDYKNGRRYVPHEGNTQLLLYLLGALRTVPAGSVQRVRLTIVQPRAVVPGAPPGSPEREAVRTWEFDEAAIAEHAVRLGDAAHATRDANPPLTPGDHCRATFCPAQALCPALNAEASAALQGAPATTEAPDLDTDLTTALTMSPDQMTPAEVARVLGAREMVRSWLKAVEEHAHKTMMAGKQVPGFKLVAGRRSRAWVEDEAELLKRFSKWNRIGDDGKTAGKLRRGDYTIVSLVSPAQAEQRIKPMVTERTWNNIEALITVSEGKPTIAAETDRRPAITITTGEEVFELDATGTDDDELPAFLR